MTRLDDPAAEQRGYGSGQRLARPTLAVARVVVEFGLPVGVYYGLRAASVGVFSALLVGAVVSAVIAAVPLVRHHRLDGMALYVATIMVCSVGVSLLAGSTQFLLARGAIVVTTLYYAAAGIYNRDSALYRPLVTVDSGRRQ
ncbi:MAG: hypothetical protein ACR2KG_02505 [Nocardioidaceae bacterium]